MLKKLPIFLLLLLLHLTVLGQNKYLLAIHSDSKQKYKTLSEKADSSSIQIQLRSYLTYLHGEGYLLASVDSTRLSTDTLHAYVSIGEKFSWLKLKPGNVNEIFLTKAGFREKMYSQRAFRYSEVAKLEKRIISYAENNGYPFAEVHLDSVVISENELSATLNYSSGPLIYFDSIEVNGATKTKAKFIQKYLGINSGDLFDQRKIKRVVRDLQALPYIEQERAPAIIFRDNKAKLVLYLKDKKANYVDGLVGILPNEAKDGKVLFTGEANILLQNLFGTGKKVEVEWKKYNQESQLLDLNYYHPAFLGSSLDLGFEFNLLKEDSSFLNLDRSVHISQSLNKYGRIGVFGNFRTSRNLLKAAEVANQDFNFIQYGLSYYFDNLDNIYFPKRGWRLGVEVSAGNKKLKNLEQESLHKEDGPNSTQFNTSFSLEKYNSTGKRTTLLTKLTGGGIYNDKNVLYSSDLFRLGGLSSLRGFNEKYFFAKTYLIGTLEYRIFLESTTYFLIFADQGYISNPLNSSIKADNPTGVGAGLSFTSGPGVFTFIYSLGRTKEQNFAFNLSKIHFGFTSRF